MVSENNDVHLYIILLVLAITNERFSNGGNVIEKKEYLLDFFYIKISIIFFYTVYVFKLIMGNNLLLYILTRLKLTQYILSSTIILFYIT